jgi:predicted anti-sigma-YlaC factor YlaD
MPKQTKLELTQINSRLATENADLRKQLADAQLKLEMLTRPTHRVARHMPNWQAERAASMAAARALAMQHGCVVKV